MHSIDGEEIRYTADGEPEIAHTFAYVRWNSKDECLRLFKDGSVSFAGRARHGYWDYGWDGEKGIFQINFNSTRAGR